MASEPRDDETPAPPLPKVATATSSIARTTVTLSLGAASGRMPSAGSTPPSNVRRVLTVPEATSTPPVGALGGLHRSLDTSNPPSLTSVEMSTPPAAVVSVGPSGTRTLDQRPEPQGDSVAAVGARFISRAGPFTLAAVGVSGLVALVGALVTWPTGPRPVTSMRAAVAVQPMAALAPGAIARAAVGERAAALPEASPSAAAPAPSPTAAPSAAAAAAVNALASALPSSNAPVTAADPVAEAASSAAAAAAAMVATHGPSGEPTDWIDGAFPSAARAPAPEPPWHNGTAASASAGEDRGTQPRIPRAGDVDAQAPRVMRAGRVVGYVEGHPQPIEVRMIDGKAVEVHCATAYERMRDAAVRAGVRLVVVSGFRTMEHQQILYRAYRMGRGNLAAIPGHSNHQSGRAVDLNTSTPGVLRWLNAHARDHGFRRTVPTEPWHWEYLR